MNTEIFPQELCETAPTKFEKHLFNSEAAMADAKKNGYCVIIPQSNELQVDIDSDAGLKMFHENLKFLQNYMEIAETLIAPSKSGISTRKHITCKLTRDVTPLERVLLQVLLGSDSRRELYSYVRIWNKDPYPTIFFERQVPGS